MKQTPSQTVGPFYALGLTQKTMNVLASEATQGEKIRIEGSVFDGDGEPVPDAMVEIWQANAYGRYNHPDDKQEKPLDPNFLGWGRSGTDKTGRFLLETIKPGRCQALTILYRLRMLTLRSLRGACSCMPIREFISATSRATKPTRCSCRSKTKAGAER